MNHHYQDLITLFNQEFYFRYNTRLVKGGDAPIYLPAGETCAYHQIIFAHGYYASALHEIAHWCIAGNERRLLEDFGYWYQPDGRNEQQQKNFEALEIKPQALEWAFCLVAKKKFNVSTDNLTGFAADTKRFKKAVYQQVLVYLAAGFPQRAQQFMQALAEFYQTKFPPSKEQFVL
jgi:elongation factor P hydroxylase